MTTLPRCADCKFWDNRGDPTRLGDCKKRAPIGLPYPRSQRHYDGVVLEWDLRTTWPLTNPADFCGEFERRD